MEDRLNVILDLDNTLIVALEEHERDNLSRQFQDKFAHKSMLAYGMKIFERPGLQSFLDYLFENFNVSVFTAAEQEYALFIINNFILIKPERNIKYMFFRYHVEMAHKRYGGVKDLRLLFNVFNTPNCFPCNTIIIDDLPDVLETNPENTIPIKPFKIVNDNGKVVTQAANDKELERVKRVLQGLNLRFKQSYFPRQIYLTQYPQSHP
jgi:TFIIF-interacting CTD phosphatase-like protein